MKVSSYTASGLATGTLPSMSLSMNSMNGTTKTTKKSSGQNKKKQLNYNPRELSTAILTAKKSQSAGRVAVRAKTKLSNLMKCKGTGQYNESELNLAISHAKRMVECAQMKMRNLRQEEREKKRYENETRAEMRQEKNEAKARASRKERNLEQKSNIEHMQRVQKEKQQKRELIRKKKLHRSQERSKLNEADLEYLKKQLRGLKEPYTASAGATTGVTLELSTQGMQLTEAQIEQQIEQEIMAEIGVEGTGTTATADISGSVVSGASAAMSVDIVV